MGTLTLILLFTVSFKKLATSQNIWDGPCGGTRITDAQATVLWPGLWDSTEHIGRLIEPLIHPNPDIFEDLVNMNPSMITVVSVAFSTRVLGVATQIRARPGAHESDIAITGASICTTISGSPTVPVFAFYGNPHGGRPRQMNVKVRQCLPHPQFNILTGANNIGLLLLDKPVPLGYPSPIQPICLPAHDETITDTVGTDGTVVGFGRYLALRQMDLRITDPSNCRGNPSSTFCVEAKVNGTGDFGSGDWGAPFVTRVSSRRGDRSMMLGMVSRHHLRIRPGASRPKSILRLAPFLEPNGWIAGAMKNHSVLWRGENGFVVQ